MKELEKSSSRAILEPLKSGATGFIIFFLLLVFIKLISFLLGQSETFKIEIEDVLLSTIGFGLLFLVKYLENLGTKKF